MTPTQKLGYLLGQVRYPPDKLREAIGIRDEQIRTLQRIPGANDPLSPTQERRINALYELARLHKELDAMCGDVDATMRLR